MTSILDRAPSAGPTSRITTERPQLPLVPTGRKPLMTILSALLVFGSIAAFATAYSRANHRQTVLIVTQTIQQGQRITASALGTASASISGALETIPASNAAVLSGRRAAVTIPSGSLLTLPDTTLGEPIAPGNAVVGMALKAGQLPSNGVEPGDTVMLVETGAPGTPLGVTVSTPAPPGDAPGTGNPGVIVSRATVFDAQGPSGSSSISQTSVAGASPSPDSQLVSVEVPESIAPSVSAAAAAGQISLVLVPSFVTPSSPAAAPTSGSNPGSSRSNPGSSGANPGSSGGDKVSSQQQRSGARAAGSRGSGS